MSDDNGNVGNKNNDPPNTSTDPNKENGDGGGGDDRDKLVTLERHKAKVGKLESRISALTSEIETLRKADEERKKAEMTEIERFKTENTELQSRLQKHEQNEKKLQAVAKAKKSLGDDLVIDAENEERLLKAVSRMTFEESSLDDDVTDIVRGFARPKGGAGSKSVAGTRTNKSDNDRDVLDLTAKELKQILKEDPERYRAIMDKRRDALAAKRASKN